MATRLEAGQIQLRPSGYSPVQQVAERQVDYITASRQEASGSQALAQALSSMASSVNVVATNLRLEESMQYVIDNPPTPEQFLRAQKGDVSGLIPKGNFTIQDQVVRKAMAFQLSNSFEREGRNFINEVATKVANGDIQPEEAKQQINGMISGYTKSVSKGSGEAALKFQATMAAEGHVVYKQALDTFVKNNKEKELIEFRSGFESGLNNYKLSARIQPDLAPEYAKILIENTLFQASLHGPIVFKEFQEKLQKEIPKARQNVLLEVLTKEEFLSNPRGTIKQLQLGIIENPEISKLVKWMKINDNETLVDTIDKFRENVRKRKEDIELAHVDDANEGKEIQRQIYGSTDIKEQGLLFEILKSKSIEPGTLKEVRAWIAEQSKPGDQESNYVALAKAERDVREGRLDVNDIAKLPLAKAEKIYLSKRVGNVDHDTKYGLDLIKLAGGQLSDSLPPNFDTAEGRKLASDAIAMQSSALIKFVSKQNDKGVFPTAAEIRAKGDELSTGVKTLLSKSFSIEAEKQRQTALMSLPQLKDIDLTNDTAVEAAITKAVKEKRSATDVNMARGAIQKHKEALKSIAGGPK
jgi:hypothetical protein